jgi:hypothetical protein
MLIYDRLKKERARLLKALGAAEPDFFLKGVPLFQHLDRRGDSPIGTPMFVRVGWAIAGDVTPGIRAA